jgi:hypothetical protein
MCPGGQASRVVGVNDRASHTFHCGLQASPLPCCSHPHGMPCHLDPACRCNVHFVTHGKLSHATACVLALDKEGLLIPFCAANEPLDTSRIHIVDPKEDKIVVAVFASKVKGECQMLSRLPKSVPVHVTGHPHNGCMLACLGASDLSVDCPQQLTHSKMWLALQGVAHTATSTVFMPDKPLEGLDNSMQIGCCVPGPLMCFMYRKTRPTAATALHDVTATLSIVCHQVSPSETVTCQSMMSLTGCHLFHGRHTLCCRRCASAAGHQDRQGQVCRHGAHGLTPLLGLG